MLSPLLVAYSLGYRFDFSSGAVEQTGGIFVKSRTPRISIFLNGTFMKETSFLSGGMVLPEISPGAYLLRLEKQGYRPWTKTVKVDAAFVTELRNIFLVPNPVTVATATPQEISLATEDSGAPAPKQDIRLDAKHNLLQRTATTSIVLAANVYAFELVGDRIIFIDRNGFLAEFNLNQKTIKVASRPGFFLGGPGTAAFLASPRGDIAILDAGGGVFSLDAEGKFEILGGGAKKSYFDAAGEKLLIVREQNLEVIWRSDNPHQPFQKKGARDLVFDTKSEILDARWLYLENAHIVIQTREGIFLTELDGRGGRNLIELTPWKTDEIATTPESPKTVFYRKGKVWYKIEFP